MLKDEELRAAYDKGDLAEEDTHRYSSFEAASRAAGMSAVEDTPLAWLGVLAVTALATAPAVYLAWKQRSKKAGKSAGRSLDAALAKSRAAAEAEAAAAAAASQASAAALRKVQANARRQREAHAAAAAAAESATQSVRAAAAKARGQRGGGGDSDSDSDDHSSDESDSPPEQGGAFRVTADALHRLSRALAKFPGGTRHRFDKIADFIGDGCTVADVSAMVKSLRNAASGKPKQTTSADSPPAPAPIAWSAEEQAALETALRNMPPELGKSTSGLGRAAVKAAVSAKWKWVSKQPGLEGKSAKACLARFRACAAVVKATGGE